MLMVGGHHPITAPQLSEVKQMRLVGGCAAFRGGSPRYPPVHNNKSSACHWRLYEQPCELCRINHLFRRRSPDAGVLFFFFFFWPLPLKRFQPRGPIYMALTLWFISFGQHFTPHCLGEVCYSVKPVDFISCSLSNAVTLSKIMSSSSLRRPTCSLTFRMKHTTNRSQQNRGPAFITIPLNKGLYT